MKTSLAIIFFLILGIAVGAANLAPEILLQNDLGTLALYLLMFLVGVSVGTDSSALKAIKTHGIKLILIPFATIVGTFVGVAILHFATKNQLFLESLAVGAGFGYYSLSSVIIGQLHCESLGVTALISNISREVITLLLAPIMVVYFGKLSPVLAAGATSMDTTLPIITRTSGREFAIIALFHGMVLTVVVPPLVTLIISMI
jgi:uncharacterized membrane protein YbjE (DUF340 family)